MLLKPLIFPIVTASSYDAHFDLIHISQIYSFVFRFKFRLLSLGAFPVSVALVTMWWLTIIWWSLTSSFFTWSKSCAGGLNSEWFLRSPVHQISPGLCSVSLEMNKHGLPTCGEVSRTYWEILRVKQEKMHEG